MKSIISLIALSTIAFTAQAITLPSLNSIYQNVCAGKSYTKTVNGSPVTTINYQPWELVRGYALGTQNDISSTTTTCYIQVDETYAFID